MFVFSFDRVSEAIAKGDYQSCLFTAFPRLSVCMRQREYRLTDFREISYFGIFIKIVNTFQF